MNRSVVRLCAAAVAVVVAVLMVGSSVDAAPYAARPTQPTAAAPSCGSTIYKADGTAWRCTFADDFTTSVLDSSKWVVQTTAQTGFTTGDRDCYVNSPNNISSSGGYL